MYGLARVTSCSMTHPPDCVGPKRQVEAQHITFLQEMVQKYKVAASLYSRSLHHVVVDAEFLRIKDIAVELLCTWHGMSYHAIFEKMHM